MIIIEYTKGGDVPVERSLDSLRDSTQRSVNELENRIIELERLLLEKDKKGRKK